MSKKRSFIPPMIGAIAGAKGGVGKSMVSSNLGVSFAKSGLKVIIMDLDLGAANQHTLFGLSKSLKSWVSALKNPDFDLNLFQVPTAQENLSVIAAPGFIPDVATLESNHKTQILEAIRKLDADVVLLDLGAGSHRYTIDFFLKADLKLIVTTAEPTSLMNNFEFIKNVLYQALYKFYQKNPEMLAHIEKFKEDSNYTFSKLMLEANEYSEWHVEHLNHLCASLKIFVVFNQLKKIEEGLIAHRLARIVKREMGLDLSYPGFVLYNEEITASVEKMLPITLVAPGCISSQIFNRMTHYLMQQLNEEIYLPLLSKAWHHLNQDFYRNRVERKKTQFAK